MSVGLILKNALSDGVKFTLSNEGELKLSGQESTVLKWLPTLKNLKPEIIQMLSRQAKWWQTKSRTGETSRTYLNPSVNLSYLLTNDSNTIEASPITEPVSLTRECGTCTHATGRNSCGNPVQAGLSLLDGVIVYHPRAGADCAAWAAFIEPELLAMIDQAVERFEFNSDDVEILRGMATNDPTGLKAAIAEFKNYPDRHQTDKHLNH